MNKQYTKEEYEKKKQELETKTPEQIKKLRQIYDNFVRNNPREHLIIDNSENAFGDFIYHSKNIFYGFETLRSENLRYCFEDIGMKDSYDAYESGFECEQQYETHASNRVKFSSFCSLGYDNSFLLYTELCNNSQNCFGCIGLKKQKNCVFNKSYSEHEYETLCGKIIDHMKATKEWGEFFPHSLSPFGYDETVAQEYFPLSEKEVLDRGWKWKGTEETSSYHGAYYKPLAIGEYDEKKVGYERAQKNIDELLSGILLCEITQKPFKVIRQELAFYIENGLALPTKHPDQRHIERLQSRNQRKLYKSVCSDCGEKIITTYSPEEKAKIVCEKCYKKIIY